MVVELGVIFSYSSGFSADEGVETFSSVSISS